MALPALLRKLFKSSGYGPELNDGIVSKTISNQDWSNSYDYPVGVVARGSDGVLYYSVAQSGPGTSAGAKNPVSAGASYWVSLDIASLESSISSALSDKVSTSTYNSGLATRVALNGSNVSSIGATLANYMANASMPSSDNAISITLPATGVDTAAMPCDGYAWFHARSNADRNRIILLQNSENWLTSSAFCNVNGWEIDAMIPVRKGQKIRCHYGSGELYDVHLRVCPCVRH